MKPDATHPSLSHCTHPSHGTRQNCGAPATEVPQERSYPTWPLERSVQCCGSHRDAKRIAVTKLAIGDLYTHQHVGLPLKYNETKRVRQRIALYGGTDVPKTPPFREGEGCYKDYSGLGNRSTFYSLIQAQYVGNTLTNTQGGPTSKTYVVKLNQLAAAVLV